MILTAIKIKPRHLRVLVMRRNGETLLSIGDRIGISSERVRNIEAQALKFMKRKIIIKYGLRETPDIAEEAIKLWMGRNKFPKYQMNKTYSKPKIKKCVELAKWNNSARNIEIAQSEMQKYGAIGN